MSGSRDHINSSSSNPDFPYECNKLIIVDIAGDDDRGVRALKYKWDARHKASDWCHVIKVKKNCDKEYFMSEILKVKKNSADIIRIYVISHGFPGCNFLSNTNLTVKLKFDQLARMLTDLIGVNKAVVNLIVCGGGSNKENKSNDESDENSFAAKLHLSLFSNLKRDVPVVARIPMVNVYFDVDIGGKNTAHLDLSFQESTAQKNKNNREHKQPGSKIVYMMDAEGNQIKADAYSYTWKAKAIKIIASQLQTKLETKKNLLQGWLSDFGKMSPREIFEVISLEFANPESVLKNHSSPRYSPAALLTTPQTYKRISELLDDGKRIFESKYTPQYPIQTRRSTT